MDIPLVQYQCNKCGTLTDVMDCDQSLPNGWTYGESRHTHYCPKCSNNSYTDISQSKKLAEILPPGSADMYWDLLSNDKYAKVNNIGTCLGSTCVYAWSLAALIDVIENIDKLQKVEVSFTHNGGKYWVDVHFGEFGSFCQDHELYDSKIDALIAMIQKFKNRNLL